MKEEPSYGKTRVNPEYTDRIYLAAFIVACLNILIVYLNIFPAKFLNASTDIKELVWPFNAGYAAALRSFHFDDFDINVVTQTTFATSTIMMAAVLIRVGLELLSVPKTRFQVKALFGLGLAAIGGGILLSWGLQFTEEHGLSLLDIHLPLVKNVFEVNSFVIVFYYGVAELLCQIIAFCHRLARRA